MQHGPRIPFYSIYKEEPRGVEPRFVHVETILGRDWIRRGNWIVEPHRHADLHQAMLWTDGGGVCPYEDESSAFEAPAVVVMPAGVVHGFRVRPGSDAVVVTISDDFLRSTLVDAPAELIAALATPLIVSTDATELDAVGLRTAFETVLAEFRGTAVGQAAAVAAHVQLLIVAVARLRAARADAAAPAPQRVQAEKLARFRALIEAHFAEDWAVSDYARALAMTDNRLNALCRQAADQSVLQIVHLRRLAEAKRLLLYTTRNVAEIGYAVGFKDPAYFSRFFARHVGVPPLAWRSQKR